MSEHDEPVSVEYVESVAQYLAEEYVPAYDAIRAAKCEPHPAPVSYPGGTQWAVKRNHYQIQSLQVVDYDQYETEDDARWACGKLLDHVNSIWPDHPEYAPELVYADIEWKVAE